MTCAPFLIYSDSIFDYLQSANTLYMVPVFAIFLGGFLSKKISTGGAKAALIGALLINAFITFVGPVNDMILSLLHLYDPADKIPLVHYVTDLHFLHRAAIVLAAAIAIMFIYPKRKTAFVFESTPAVDLTPWRFTKPFALGTAALIFGIYAYLW